MRRALLLAVFATLVAGTAHAQAPPVPPNRDPGGVLVALLGPGIDYRQSALSAKLARDGEGELIGWDMIDDSRRPFDAGSGTAPSEHGGDATALANLLLADAAPMRLAPVRVEPTTPASLARAAVFVAQTGGRVALVPMWGRDAARWEPFRLAAIRNPNVLFILAAADGTDAENAFPAAFGLDNAIVVSAGSAQATASGFAGAPRTVTGGHLGAVLAARTAARLLAREPTLDIARLKAAIETPADGRH